MKYLKLWPIIVLFINPTFASDYTLKIMAPIIPSAGYDLQTNIFEPSARTKAKELLKEKISKASLLAFVPLLSSVPGNLTDLNFTPEITGNFMDLATSSVSNLGSTLLSEIENIKKTHPELVAQLDKQIVQEFYVMPWQSNELDNLFYNSQKVSASASQEIPYRTLSRDSKKFQEKLNSDLLAYHKLQSRNGKLPVYLLGIRSFVFVDFQKESHFTLRVLVGLKNNPNLVPDFNNPAPEVILDKIVLPKGRTGDIVAAMNFHWSISDKNLPPTLTIRFGELKGIAKGEFVLDQKKQARITPRLEGQIVVPGILAQIKARMSKDEVKNPSKTWLKILKWSESVEFVAMNFSFQKIVMDLSTAKLTSVTSLMSPGIRIKKTNYVLGSFSNAFIDDTFKIEINRGIEMQMNMVMKKIMSYGEVLK